MRHPPSQEVPEAPAPPSSEPSPIRFLDPDVPPWRLWTLFAVLALGVGLWVLASVVVGIVAGASGSSLSNPAPGVSLALDFVFDLSFVAAVIWFTVIQGGGRASDFGFRRVRLSLAIAGFLTAGIGYYVLTLIYAAVFALHGQDKLPSELDVNHDTAALIGATVFVCVVAPMAEELFFRGFVFGALRHLRVTVAGRELGTWIAAVITGILFGLVHTGSASPQYLVPLGLLGFVLCLLRWRTGSLYPCMALHSVNNSLALGVNQWHWNAGEIVGLMAASLLVIATVTGRLAGPELTPSSPSAGSG